MLEKEFFKNDKEKGVSVYYTVFNLNRKKKRDLIMLTMLIHLSRGYYPVVTQSSYEKGGIISSTS